MVWEESKPGANLCDHLELTDTSHLLFKYVTHLAVRTVANRNRATSGLQFLRNVKREVGAHDGHSVNSNSVCHGVNVKLLQTDATQAAVMAE